VQIGSAQYSSTRATGFVAANSGYAAGTFHVKKPRAVFALEVALHYVVGRLKLQRKRRYEAGCPESRRRPSVRLKESKFRAFLHGVERSSLTTTQTN
jgi:hypothetical protein